MPGESLEDGQRPHASSAPRTSRSTPALTSGAVIARLIVICGPSGAGKGTLIGRATSALPGLALSVSATTRPPRAGEESGREYHFLSPARFRSWVRGGRFLEWAEFGGYLYGTPREAVEELLESGQDVVLEIELEGAKQVLANVPEAALVFIAPPSVAELEARLHRRGTETDEAIDRRMEEAWHELMEMSEDPAWLSAHEHYVIVNEDVDSAADDLITVIRQIRRDHKDI